MNLLGYSESPPPFLYLIQNYTENFKTENIKGVNFASGGSGLLNDTGKRFVSTIYIFPYFLRKVISAINVFILCEYFLKTNV